MKISAVKATLYLGILIFLQMYIPHLLYLLGEIWYKGSENNVIEHL
jgi:hypothetical protein